MTFASWSKGQAVRARRADAAEGLMQGMLAARVMRTIDACGVSLGIVRTFVDFWVRFSLANGFLISGMVGFAHGHGLPGFERQEVLLRSIDPNLTSVAVVVVEVAGPVLLAIGLWVRPAALMMLIVSVATQFTFPQSDTNLFWAALFGWYVVHGAGAFSLDRMLAQGLGSSALPLAQRAMAAGKWVRAEIGPLYRLAARLWLALALTGVALPGAVFPVASGAALARPVAWGAAALLAAGLGTNLVVGILAVLFALMAAMAPGDGVSLCAPLLFALLGVAGGGRCSLDGMLLAAVRKRPEPASGEPHVVIVGAGFGGMACAAGLRHARVRVTLIDRRNYHLFQPLLYQVATAGLSPGDIAAPIRAQFRDDARITIRRGAVTGIDTGRRRVLVDGRELGYEYLVLATGASHGYFGNEHWAEHAPGLKFVEDAIAIRGRILGAFERAEEAEDGEQRAALLTFLICGGGPTGVELAGAIAELARHGMKSDFRRCDPATSRVILVQAGRRILPNFPEPLSAAAQASLERLGVEVRLNSVVEAVDADGAVVNGVRVAAGTVLWAAGVVASPAALWLGTTPDRAGRIKVGADLSVPGIPDVFAVGDTAFSLAWRGEPVPGLAPAARQGGAHVARVIKARLAGAPPPSFRYRHRGSLATIGRKSAVADFGRIRLRGSLAWWLWGAVHVFSLIGTRNRAAVIVGWLWSYLSWRAGVPLITVEPAQRSQARRFFVQPGEVAR